MNGTPAIMLAVGVGILFLMTIVAKLVPLLSVVGGLPLLRLANASGLGKQYCDGKGSRCYAMYSPCHNLFIHGYAPDLVGPLRMEYVWPGCLAYSAASGCCEYIRTLCTFYCGWCSVAWQPDSALGFGLMFVNLEKIRAVADALMAIRDLSVTTGECDDDLRCHCPRL